MGGKVGRKWAAKSVEYLMAMRRVVAGERASSPLEKALKQSMADDPKAFNRAYLVAEQKAASEAVDAWDGKGCCPTCGVDKETIDRPFDGGTQKAMDTIDRILATFA